MPKRPQTLDGGRMPLRDRLVARLKEEQENRGWSDAKLATRISKRYPMSATTVWKLKNAEPPRGVSIDEANAIAVAFDFDTVDEMLEANAAVGAVLEHLKANSSSIAPYDEDTMETYRDADETLRDCFDLLRRQRSPLTPKDAERIHEALNALEGTVDDVHKAITHYSGVLRKTIDEFRAKLPDATQQSTNSASGGQAHDQEDDQKC